MFAEAEFEFKREKENKLNLLKTIRKHYAIPKNILDEYLRTVKVFIILYIKGK